MKKSLLSVLLIISILLSLAACSKGGGNKESGSSATQNEIPTGIWVLRYYGDENGNYIEDINMTEDYYYGQMSYIEKEILDYEYLERFELDDSGKGVHYDDFDEATEVSFDAQNVTFGDDEPQPYHREGDFLWFQRRYQDHYCIMENVSPEMLAKIRNGGFACVDLAKAKVGDLVAFGNYDTWPFNEKTETLRWQVIDQDGDKLLILCDRLIDAFSYNHNPEMKNLANITWENSSLREFLNDPQGFLLCFDEEELAKIQTSHLENKAANEELMKYWGNFEDDPSLNEIPNYSTMAIQDLPDDPETDDKVFLLSFQEIEKYFGEASETYSGKGEYPFTSYPASSAWKAYVTPSFDYINSFGYYDQNTLAGAWMTRTLCTDHHDEKMVAYITSEGQIYSYFTYTPLFIRPAMWITR